MKVIVSARRSSVAAHGGPVIARRHAHALARQGLEVLLCAPEPSPVKSDGAVNLAGYEGSTEGSSYLRALRPSASASKSFREVLDRTGPDLLYDVSGPAWPIAEAAACGIPVVSMVGDYNWYCARSFLVDSEMRRCTGPESLRKCFQCETRGHPLKRRIVQGVLRHAADAGIESWPALPKLLPYRVWQQLQESGQFLARLRAAVAYFVIGDRQAERFFESHGVSRSRMAFLPQALPAPALERYPRNPLPAAFSALRPLRIGFVGRLDVEKGFQVLADAFESFDDEVPLELHVVHVDDAVPGRLVPMFRNAPRVETWLSTGRVRLVRPGSPSEVFAAMAQVDLGVVPSLAYESPSLAMLEFVAQRTPVVRSESDGMSHVIVDGLSGRTFPYGDDAALHSVLGELLRAPESIERYRAALPAVGGEDEYARALAAVFARATAGEPRSAHG